MRRAFRPFFAAFERKCQLKIINFEILNFKAFEKRKLSRYENSHR